MTLDKNCQKFDPNEWKQLLEEVLPFWILAEKIIHKIDSIERLPKLQKMSNDLLQQSWIKSEGYQCSVDEILFEMPPTTLSPLTCGDNC